MPRPPRLLLSKSYYHIITRGNNQNKVFRSEADYHYYLKRLKEYKEELPFDLYHYCLMPTHVHQLVKTKKAWQFSLFMKKLNLAYYHYFHNKYKWTGHFWQGRFRSQPVGKDDYFLQCGKYIELNPARARLINDPGNYKYSSYNYYSFGEEDDLITRDIFYDELGKNEKERQINYQKLIVEEMVGDSEYKDVWGSKKQIYQERKKISYHLRKK